MEDGVYQELSIFSGNAHPALAQAICDYLGRPLGRAKVFEFTNENIFVEIADNVRQRDVFIVQPLVSPVNTRVMELLIMIDAFSRASAGRITAVIPYYAYGRSDKKDQPRVPITARLLANLLETAGADRILTMDLHAGQIQGFFNVPVDELTAAYTIAEYFKQKALDNVVVVATDLGSAKRARNLAERLSAPLALVEKRRVSNDDSTELMNVIGEVEGRRAVVVDDEIDTAGTLMQTVQALCDRGVIEVYAAATHGILSGPAVQRLCQSPLREIVLSDTVPLPEHKQLDRITTLTVAPMLGQAISRIHTGQSVGALFQ
ncbi:MAG: ribose-phosphate pyrophosphokinase [Chloroflexi bacterium]|nr:ribose-phosphate pyrophosphokinase [Chloroflexota bacterium]